MFKFVKVPKEVRLIEKAEKIEEQLLELIDKSDNIIPISLAVIAIDAGLDKVKRKLKERLEKKVQELSNENQNNKKED